MGAGVEYTLVPNEIQLLLWEQRIGADRWKPQGPMQSLRVLGWQTHCPRLSLPSQASVGPPPGSSSASRAGPLHKAAAQPEEKKPEVAGSRLERRDQLKKANTLPTSVTGSESRTVST